MHMADALLTPAVGGGFWIATLGTVAYSARKLREKMNERLIPLMGVLGAFVFAGQMINFTIPGTGSSGHIGGGMLLAILIGPHAAFVVIASVLTVQALFFADGGLLALGANIWNIGMYPCYVAYPLIYRPMVKENLASKRITVAALLSVVTALQFGSLSVVIQAKLSGISDLSFSSFLLFMQPIHLAIGIIEGFITAGVVKYVRTVQPEVLEMNDKPDKTPSMKRAIIAITILAIITGGVFSWFASTYPDGLEWSIDKIHGKQELPQELETLTEMASKIQDRTSLMADYSLAADKAQRRGKHAGRWPAVDTGTSVAGLVGALIVLVSILLVGYGLRMIARKRK